MTIKALYPTVRPTLNLNFAQTKALDPRITFTRASTATFVGSNGLIQTAASGAARFDHNPTTGESLGLLVEEARTNSLLHSGNIITVNDYTVRPIAENLSTFTPNADIAPDGTMSAYLINPSNSYGGVGVPSNVFPVVSGQSYTASIWVKKVPGITYQNLSIVTNGWASPDFVSVNSLINSSSGWIRVSATFTSNETASRAIFFIRQQSGYAVPSQPIYVWGPQLETGAFPTSYIPTTTATVTRAADVASMTGTNFSSWYNQSEGTCVLSAKKINSNESYLFNFSDNTNNNRILSQPAGYALYVQSTTAQAQLSSAISANSNFKIAVGVKQNSFNLANNGTLGTLDTSGIMPVGIDRLHLFSTHTGTEYSSGTIARLAYYPVRLPDAQLQALTAT
jgi:hypothetical protein